MTNRFFVFYLPVFVLGTLVVAIMLAIVITRFRRRSNLDLFGMSREDVRERWTQIEKTSRDGVMGAKLAVMEADSLLDSVFKSMAMPGNTLGERLKVASARYPEIRSVWWAHKLRNQIAHDSSFRLGNRQAKNALDEFHRALKKLGAL